MPEPTPPPDTLVLDRRDGSAMQDLYRAALGPVQREANLRAFTRFDAAGKSGLGWNWAAALLTLNWMAFHRLWLAALAYVSALTSAVLLFGLASLAVSFPAGSHWVVLAVVLLLSVVVPGAWGDAWLYRACTQRLEHALQHSATPQEACVLLARHAAGKPRLGALALANLALAGAVVATVLAWPDTRTLALNRDQKAQPRLRTADAVTPVATVAAATPVALASAPTSAPDLWMVNLSLFADFNSARNAVVRLGEAGLRAQAQERATADGPHIWVRVGPFQTQPEAQRTAERVRALGLDATVARP